MNAVLTMSRDVPVLSERDRLARTATPSRTLFVGETATELLRTIAGVLDIRSVFPRISEIVQQVVPHDALGLRFADRAGRATREARSTVESPAQEWCATAEEKEYTIASGWRRAIRP